MTDEELFGIVRSDVSDWDRIVAAYAIKHPDLRKYALARVPSVEDLAERAVWSGDKEGQEPLWYVDASRWILSLDGGVVATERSIDLGSLIVPWVRWSAWYVLPVWEEWAAKHAPEHLDAPREALENPSDVTIKAVKEAEKAAWAARDGALAAKNEAWKATWAAWAAAEKAEKAAEKASVVAAVVAEGAEAMVLAGLFWWRGDGVGEAARAARYIADIDPRIHTWWTQYVLTAYLSR